MAKIETTDNYVSLVEMGGRWMAVSPAMIGELNLEFPYRTEAEAWRVLNRFIEANNVEVSDVRVGRGWTKRLLN